MFIISCKTYCPRLDLRHKWRDKLWDLTGMNKSNKKKNGSNHILVILCSLTQNIAKGALRLLKVCELEMITYHKPIRMGTTQHMSHNNREKPSCIQPGLKVLQNQPLRTQVVEYNKYNKTQEYPL